MVVTDEDNADGGDPRPVNAAGGTNWGWFGLGLKHQASAGIKIHCELSSAVALERMRPTRHQICDAGGSQEISQTGSELSGSGGAELLGLATLFTAKGLQIVVGKEDTQATGSVSTLVHQIGELLLQVGPVNGLAPNGWPVLRVARRVLPLL
jgi:hypothetical protein